MNEQLRFWIAFQEYMAKTSKIECQKPQSRHWMNHSIGWPSDIHLTAIISTRKPEMGEPEIRAELGLLGVKAKQRFDALKLQQKKIEQECGVPLTWHTPPKGKDMCKIYVSKDTDFRQEKLWAEQQQWLRVNLELLQKVFDPFIQKIE